MPRADQFHMSQGYDGDFLAASSAHLLQSKHSTILGSWNCGSGICFVNLRLSPSRSPAQAGPSELQQIISNMIEIIIKAQYSSHKTPRSLFP
jgi:hypothetical protein